MFGQEVWSLPPAGVLLPRITALTPGLLARQRAPFGQKSRRCSERSASRLLGPEGVPHHLCSPCQGDGGRGGMRHGTPVPNWEGTPQLSRPMGNRSRF